MANQLTEADILAKIKTIDYVRGPGTLTFCILTLENGFTVTGESACADPAGFNADIGERYAYNDAKEKVWRLEGYLLKQRMYEERSALKKEPQGPFDFSKALDYLKSGNSARGDIRRVAREGWNGKGMWITITPGCVGLPSDRFWSGANRAYAQDNGGKATVRAHITMKTADGEIVPWVASQTDLLAEDWMVVE